MLETNVLRPEALIRLAISVRRRRTGILSSGPSPGVSTYSRLSRVLPSHFQFLALVMADIPSTMCWKG